jgi:hypothetical protein
MKAMGNFTVDFEWQDGQVQQATIESHAGAPLRVRCTRGAKEITAATVTVDGKKAKVKVDKHGIATIPCKKGQTVTIAYCR